ncbi:hypothetical protein VTO42DRAFT_1779 [Malbranchea cinnamomea]
MDGQSHSPSVIRLYKSFLPGAEGNGRGGWRLSSKERSLTQDFVAAVALRGRGPPEGGRLLPHPSCPLSCSL